MALGDLLVQIRATANEWAADIKAIQKEGKELEKSIKPIKDQAQEMGTAFAVVGGLIVGSFVAITKSTADYGDELNDARQRTGVAVEDLAKLGFAAEQSGSSFEGMTTGLKFLAKNMEDASSGGKKQKEAFDSLGISVTDATGKLRPAKDVFMDVADRFNHMEDGAEKTAVAMDIFGKAGADLIPTLNSGRDGLEEMGEAAERTGLVISGDTAEASDEFNDALAELIASTKGISIAIGTTFLPILKDFITIATDVVQGVKDWTKEHPDLVRAVGALGVALSGAGGLLLGLAGVLAILPQLSTAFTLLTGPVGLTILAVAGLVTGIVYFKDEIASGLLKSLSLAVDGFSTFIGYAADLADAVGLDGVAGKLQAMSASTLQASSDLTLMADSFLEETGTVIANTQALNDAIAATQTHTFEMKQNTDAADKNKKTISDMVAKNAQALNDHLADVQDAGRAWINVTSDAYSKDLEGKIKAFSTIEDIIASNRVAMGKHLEGVTEDNRKWLGTQSQDYTDALDKRKKDLDDAEKKSREAYQKTFDSVKDTASRTFTAVFADGKFQFGALADVIKGIFGTLATEILSSMTATLITPLVSRMQSAMASVMSGVPGLGGVVGGGSRAAGMAQAPIGGLPAGGLPSGGAGGAAGAAGGFLSGGLGVITQIAGDVGIIMQLKRLEGTLNGIEHNTRYAQLHLQDTMEQILQPMKGSTDWIANRSSDLLNQGDAIFSRLGEILLAMQASGLIVLNVQDDDASGLLATIRNRGDVRAQFQQLVGART